MEYVYHPDLHFTTTASKVRQFRSPHGEDRLAAPYQPGAAVPMLYDPERVFPPMIDSWLALWGATLFAFASGSFS
jgi:hypothetical protein